MKVYIVTRIPFPNGMAPANRVKCYAKAIKSQEVEVEILVYTRTEIHGNSARNTDGNGNFEGITFRYIGGTPFRNKNLLFRRFYDYKDKKNCLKYLKKNLRQGDVVLGYIGHDIDYTVELINTIHACKAKFVRDLCELPYGTSVETKDAIKNREKVLKLQAPICDGYICISKALLDYINPHTRPDAKNIIVPILVDYDKYELPDLSSKAEYPYIFHAGSLTEQKDGVLGMLVAFGIASKSLPSSVKFILTGYLDKAKAANEIKEIIKKYDIEERVIFTGYLSDDELKKYLSEASLVIINKYNTQQNQYCFSTKLGEYLAAGKPVIITNVGEAMNWLKNQETAYVVDPENKQQLAEAIVDSFINAEKRHKIAEEGRNLCKNSFDYRMWGTDLIRYFSDIENI